MPPDPLLYKKWQVCLISGYPLFSTFSVSVIHAVFILQVIPGDMQSGLGSEQGGGTEYGDTWIGNVQFARGWGGEGIRIV